MDYRVLVRFVGSSEDCGDWYSVDDVMIDEYECRFEELPESEQLAMDGSLVVEDGIPEDVFSKIMERFEHVFGAFKWSSYDVGVCCGTSDGWDEFNPDCVDDYSDEANEISESVLGF